MSDKPKMRPVGKSNEEIFAAAEAAVAENMRELKAEWEKYWPHLSPGTRDALIRGNTRESSNARPARLEPTKF